MKTLIKNIKSAAIVLALGTLAACSPESYDHIDPNGRPDASDIDVTVSVDQETNTYTLTLNNKGYYPLWTVNVGNKPKTSTQNNFSGVITEAGTYQVEVRMGNRNGLSKGSKIYDIVIDKSLGGDIFKGYVYDNPFNLWKTCNLIDYTTWFANNDWNADAVTQPDINLANDEISLVLPDGMGASQWQGQLHINTDMASSAASNYDFSIFFLSAASHPGVTVKLHPTGDDGNFYCEAKVPLEGGVGKAFYITNVAGLDAQNLTLTLDFAGGEPGSEIVMSNIVFKDHANDDGTVLPPSVEFDDARNLFNGFSVANITTWFANNEWNADAIAQPTINPTSDGYYFTMPDGVGGQQWQGQVHFWTSVETSASKHYDFRATITSTEDCPNVTFKIQNGDSLGASTDDDNIFFIVANFPVKANTPYTYYFENLPGIDTKNIQICADYAGTPGGAEITVSKLHIQEHL